MMTGQIDAVMIYVDDPESGLEWYERAFPAATRVHYPESNFTCLRFGRINLELVRADSKGASGAAGSIVYWRVADFTSALVHMQSIGATLYRGPMDIEDGEAMCQVRDPWGNCIGLRGPRAS